MVTVKEIMHAITVVDADDSVHDAALLMDRKDIGSVLVRVKGELKGILTERDILKRVVARSLDANRTSVRHVMSPLTLTIQHDAGVLEASALFKDKHIRRLPVTEGGRIIGIVTTRDLSGAMPFAVEVFLKRSRERERGELPLFP